MDRTWLAPHHAQLLEGHDLAGDTIYGVLERECGIPIRSGRYRITATVAQEELAGVLGVATGDPLLVIERTSRLRRAERGVTEDQSRLSETPVPRARSG